MPHRREIVPQSADSDTASESVPLSRLVGVMRQYRYVIGLTLLGSMLFYALIAVGIVLFGPSQKVASLPFRLEFAGAHRGEYPNGTRFSVNDVVATRILRQVYLANDLGRFVEFKSFADAVFVVEANEALERLTNEYRTRLADSRISSIERHEIQQEFIARRDSLSRSDFSLNLLIGGDTRRIPRPVITKVLSDILSVWSEHAVMERGATRYRVPVLTENILPRGVTNHEPVIGLDILRSKTNQVIRNIDQLLGVPGAEVLRAGESGVSLAELRIQLDDVVRMRVRPMTLRVHNAALTQSREETMRFFEAQLEYNEHRYQEEQVRTEKLKAALETYDNSARPGVEVPGASPRTSSNPGAGAEVVMPQISESFLERIVSLSGQNADREYRQNLVDEIKASSLQALPFRSEALYYQSLIPLFRRATTPNVSNDELGLVREELNGLIAELSATIRDVNAVYSMISSNLNAASNLYTVLQPPSIRIQRSVPLALLAIAGVLIALVVLPLAIVGAFLHHRVKEEESAEAAIQTSEPVSAVETPTNAAPA